MAFLFILLIQSYAIHRTDAFTPIRVEPTTTTATARAPTALNLFEDIVDRRAALSSSAALIWTAAAAVCSPPPAYASEPFGGSPEAEGVSAVTRSELGKSVRRGAVRGAQIADGLDLKWERFSDGLRDQNRCDPRTNRRLFDNGTRKDGTSIGNPVLGALCEPVPLRPFDGSEGGVPAAVGRLAAEAAEESLRLGTGDLRGRVDEVRKLVGPSFSRVGGASSAAAADDDEETRLRLAYNMDVYTSVRAYGEALAEGQPRQRKALNAAARRFDVAWGERMLRSLAPNAGRKDFITAFALPDVKGEELPYNEGTMLDALGSLSVALDKMQRGGIIGHWEIGIPEDDYGSVVTIAVDDDISIGAQVLLKEQGRPLMGSAAVALVRAALERAKITYAIDTFFIDPTTTRQELYNPTQLLVSLSDLGE